MKYTPLIKTALLTLGCAAALAFVSWLGERSGTPPHTAAVFAGQKPAELTNDNLVDGLSSLDLPVPIGKVDLTGGILSVDLKVTEEDFSADRIYQGMAEMLAFSFERTSNVDQLLLRLFAEDRWLGTKYLLLAADVRRSDWRTTDLAELRQTGDRQLSEALRQRLRVTETQLWMSRFLRAPAGR
ncbi:hypothetical protein [Paenibacillus macerans]|uniref:Lipoprotein n=1 Tax=Paenibacillus macerans TaxID=44252 RepID=A0A090ZHD8_PAEMA|nr:hypothetical protein [Paenibacillus macerans]KFN09615.1 hypothetical protein DJ90_3174 [Paenibacillus macerans]MCY7561667.1 hypothetical protein [Paenibacillus macerans]MEC0150604.1 hypothetical protein [Paenibacillus macerans]MEC0328142.1 hypothetical protein [Paenibacillus macerans]SUA82583.1 Uncharacterised protein [Paenibacillus macerans]